MNLYAYAGNNPISYDDPFGLCPFCFMLDPVPAIQQSADWQAQASALAPVIDAYNQGNSDIAALTAAGLGLQSLVEGIGATPAASTNGGLALRYLSGDEPATVAHTNEVPNADAAGAPKKIHFTTDEPMTSGEAAKKRYKLTTTPTHYTEFPLSQVRNHVAPAGSVAADATQSATSLPIAGASRPIPLQDK